jgi:amino acid adenylation domain-containing protein
LGPQGIRSNGPFVPFAEGDVERSIAECFRRQAERHPHHLAVRSLTEAWTYAELDQLADRLASALLQRRGPANEPVGLLLGHSAAMVAAILGVLRAGKIYVPLDPRYPAPRLEQMLHACGAQLIVVDGPAGRALGGRWADKVQLLDMAGLTAAHSGPTPAAVVRPDQPAVILYTSGSTGRPKGVVQSHRAILHNTRTYTNCLRIGPADRLTLLSSCSFAASTCSLFGALLNGATLYPFDLKEQGIEPLAAWLAAERITIYHSVPTVFRQLAAALEPGLSFPALRVLNLGGEAASLQDIELYRKHFSRGCVLLLTYAATETNVICRYLLDEHTPLPEGVVPAGYPCEGTEVLLVDESGRPVAPGQCGEVVVRSRYLADGYWGQPEETARKFAAAANDPGVRSYHTGDWGSLLPDGCLVHRGRKDALVKVRGHRVDVAEVEAALAGVPGVREAAVIAGPDEHGQARLVAYLVPAARPGTTAAVRAALAQVLPDFMLPSAWVCLEALPLGPSGKVDRSLLRSLPLPPAERAAVGPRNDLEARLARIWAEVLRTPSVAVTEDFFDMGGDSLRAAALLRRLERAFGRNLTFAALLEAPTVERQAEWLSEKQAPRARCLVPIQPHGSRPPLFLVHLGGGHVLRYYEMTRHLPPEQPVYGIQARGLDGEAVPLCSIEEMASWYLQEVRAVQPHGPYRIGGMCIGGLIALEMAQQLRQEGEEVALLAVLDTRLVPGMHGGATRAPAPLRRLIASVTAFGTANPGAAVVRWGKRLWWRGRKRLALLTSGQARRSFRIMRACERARKNYRPRPYPGRITLFRSSTEAEVPAHQKHWAELACGGLECHVIPGIHQELVTGPAARILAEQLGACLEKALRHGEKGCAAASS